MDFRHLETFHSVARHKSFTRAAEELHLSQSAVSARIQALEADLGVPLFDRLGRGVVLTEAGEKLFGYARRMADMAGEIRAELAGGAEGRGSLTVRAPESLAQLHLPGVVEAFLRDNPAAGLTFIGCTDRMLREELQSGRIDLAFLMAEAVGLPGVAVELLGAESLVLAAAPDHPLAGRRIGPADLHGRTLLLTGMECSYRKPFLAMLEEGGVVPRLLVFASALGMRPCLERGLGLTLCLEKSVRGAVRAGRLAVLDWTGEPLATPVLMIRRQDRWCSPLLERFMDLSRAAFRQDPAADPDA